MEPTNESRGPSRRRVIGVGTAAVGAAWVTPQIISAPAASAATAPPPPKNGSISGFVFTCGHEADPGDTFLVTAVQNPGGATGSDTSAGSGAYAIAALPPGTYDITLHPNGPGNTGNPDDTFPGAVVVSSGSDSPFNPNYQANGC